MPDQTPLQWLQAWYASRCNGDWEHQSGVHISTIDNPGWSLTIDLEETEFSDLSIPYVMHERAEDDWYDYSAKDGKFKAYGDPLKLELLILKFREVVEANADQSSAH